MPKTPSSPKPKKTVEIRPPLRQNAERALTVKEIAVLDRCSEKTVRRAIRDGLLQTFRVGPGSRLLRISPQAHAAYRHLNQR